MVSCPMSLRLSRVESSYRLSKRERFKTSSTRLDRLWTQLGRNLINRSTTWNGSQVPRSAVYRCEQASQRSMKTIRASSQVKMIPCKTWSSSMPRSKTSSKRTPRMKLSILQPTRSNKLRCKTSYCSHSRSIRNQKSSRLSKTDHWLISAHLLRKHMKNLP